jgi:hypothetical protein
MTIAARLHDVLGYRQFIVEAFQVRHKCVMSLLCLSFLTPLTERTTFPTKIPDSYHDPLANSFRILHPTSAASDTSARMNATSSGCRTASYSTMSNQPAW